RRKRIGPPRLSGRRTALRLGSTDPVMCGRESYRIVEYPALQRELAGPFFELLIEPASLAEKSGQLVHAPERRSLGCAIAFYIDAEQAKGVQFAWPPRDL